MSRTATYPQTQPATQPTSSSATSAAQTAKIPQDKIAMRAYEKWCQHGRQHGRDAQDWIDAEAELRSEMARTKR